MPHVPPPPPRLPQRPPEQELESWRPSWPPDKRAHKRVLGVPDYVWRALVLALTAAASVLTTLSQTERPPTPPRTTAQPANPEPKQPLGKPDTTPTTDEGVIACRTLEARLNPLLVELERRAAVSEARSCALEQELRDLEARDLERDSGKRGRPVRKDFEDQTTAWRACPLKLEDVRARRSLREVADSVLGR